MTWLKLDSNGNYQTFRGLTIVSSINDEDFSFWEKVYNLIINNNQILNYFSPLPFESYHVTTTNLYTETYIGKENWKSFVLDKLDFFQSLNETLKNQAFNPIITFDSINVTGVINISVNLYEEHVDIINNIAKKFDIISGVPKPFHITLAYRNKNIDQNVADEIKKQLTEEITDLTKLYRNQIIFNSPKLCYFNDMKEFIPWNATEYPF